MKENKKRIIFWAFIMIIFLFLGIYGRSSFKQGFGRYGAMKKILEPIVIEFNTLDDVKKLTDTRAEVIKNDLVVTYITTDNKKEKYVYTYSNENGIESIANQDAYNSIQWNFIAKHMADAVYHANGGKGSIFDLYSYEIFRETNLTDGLIYDEISKNVSINIRTNVVKNIKGKYKSLFDDIYVKDVDLATLINDLKTNNVFTYNNQDIKIYVKNTTKSYDIYAAITEENSDRVYKSIANIIKFLKSDVYSQLKIENEVPQFESENTSYYTQYNATFSEASIFTINDNLFELSLFK